MDRRQFIGALGAASLAVKPSSRLARLRPLGLQLYTVRDAMRHDFEGTLARVARVGYTEVEFHDYFGHTPAQVRDALRSNRLAAPGIHVGYSDMGDGWRQRLDDAKAIGHQYVVCAWIDQSARRTLDGWRRVAERLNRAADEAQAAGLGFAYHNHSYEFVPLEGRIPFDVLLEATDPVKVKLEMDLYWITIGGQDPLAYFARYPGRIHLVHVKDMTTDRRMVDVGAGSIDWRRIFAQRQQAGIRHYFVEHDEPPDPFASIAASYRYLSRLRV